jgi:hypothetical protein
MVEPTTAELLARIETLEGRQRTRTRRRGVRMALSVVALAALLAVPIGVFASHSFTDVPNSNTFHTQIGRVKGAGITTGCSPTTYCPNDEVTRGQMAAFLARTGGRGSSAGLDDLTGIAISNDQSSPTVMTTVSIKAGDVTGGYAVVQLSGSVTAYTTSATGLPSYVIAYIREQGTTAALSSWGFAQVDALAGGFIGVATADLVGSVTVPTGVTKTYEVAAYRVWGTGTFLGFGALSATYVPFAGDGSNAVPVTAPASESDSPLLGP